MPTYEFRCPAGHETEKFFRKISDGLAEIACAVCGEPANRQVSAGAGLVFKGSGFYITDYGKDGKKDQRQAAASKSSAKPEAASAGASATESAPTAKPEARSESAAASRSEPKPDATPKSAAKSATPKSGSAE